VKSLHIATAVLELGAGLALLFFPSETATIMAGGILDTPVALTVARVGGSGLIALGLASWLARNESSSRADMALIAALLFFNFAVAAVLAYAGLALHLHGVALWPAVMVHTVMGLWCGASLRRSAGTRRA
jgi:hypothetical protein